MTRFLRFWLTVVTTSWYCVRTMTEFNFTPYKVWSRFEAGTTAIVLADTDASGVAPAHISMVNEESPRNGMILVSEWSTTELAPTPQTVPGTLFLAVGGQDPFNPEYQVLTTEDAAKAAVTGGAWGYVPFNVGRLMSA